MAYPEPIRRQLKKCTAARLIRALESDGWKEQKTSGATRSFVKPESDLPPIVIHYHPKKTYGMKLLTKLLGNAGWNEDNLRRLRLIK